MKKTTNDNILEIIAEEINYNFEDSVKARDKGEYLYLTLLEKRVQDCYELEEAMEDVFDFVNEEFDADINVVDYNKQTLAVEVYTY